MTNILEYYVPESEGALRALQGSLPRYTKLGLRKKMREIKRQKVEVGRRWLSAQNCVLLRQKYLCGNGNGTA